MISVMDHSESYRLVRRRGPAEAGNGEAGVCSKSTEERHLHGPRSSNRSNPWLPARATLLPATLALASLDHRGITSPPMTTRVLLEGLIRRLPLTLPDL